MARKCSLDACTRKRTHVCAAATAIRECGKSTGGAIESDRTLRIKRQHCTKERGTGAKAHTPCHSSSVVGDVARLNRSDQCNATKRTNSYRSPRQQPTSWSAFSCCSLMYARCWSCRAVSEPAPPPPLTMASLEDVVVDVVIDALLRLRCFVLLVVDRTRDPRNCFWIARAAALD